MGDIKRGTKLAADIERLSNPKVKPTETLKPTKQKYTSKKTVQGHNHNK